MLCQDILYVLSFADTVSLFFYSGMYVREREREGEKDRKREGEKERERWSERESHECVGTSDLCVRIVTKCIRIPSYAQASPNLVHDIQTNKSQVKW